MARVVDTGMTNFGHYRSLVRHLRKHVELDYPISIRRTRLPDGLDGDATLANGRFVVRINRKLTENSAIDTVIHEISHCVVLESHQGHGPAWGMAYSRVYQEYLVWLDGI